MRCPYTEHAASGLPNPAQWSVSGGGVGAGAGGGRSSEYELSRLKTSSVFGRSMLLRMYIHVLYLQSFT